MINDIQAFIDSLNSGVKLEAKRNGGRDETGLSDDAREVLEFTQPATLYRYKGRYYVPELGLEADSLSVMDSEITEWYCDTLLDKYSTEYRNGVRIMTYEQLMNFAQFEYLTVVEENGMSGTNPGYYLYWAELPDGTREEINVKPEYE